MSTGTQEAISVAALTAIIKSTLEQSIPALWVAGEISDLARPRSGHLYFTLKDQTSQVRCCMWRSSAGKLPFALEDGQSVLAFGSVEVYVPRGSYQLIVRRVQPQGMGSLQLAFEQLREKLAGEGLFAAERKQPLPAFPLRIGVVTSPSGAAIRDFCQVAQRRWPGTQIVIIPTKVQGLDAAPEIAAAIQKAERIRPHLDVLVVGRGGGSMEDLWCFNDERTVRAIANCQLPVISAIGHEIDVTLADLAADVRAATPTEAAERLIPSQSDIRELLSQRSQRLQRTLRERLRRASEQLQSLHCRPVLSKPFDIIYDRTRRVDELELRLRSAVRSQTKLTRERIAGIAARLDTLSPLNTLRRGYSIVSRTRDGQLVSGSEDTKAGEEIKIQTSKAVIEARVESVQESQTGSAETGQRE